MNGSTEIAVSTSRLLNVLSAVFNEASRWMSREHWSTTFVWQNAQISYNIFCCLLSFFLSISEFRHFLLQYLIVHATNLKIFLSKYSTNIFLITLYKTGNELQINEIERCSRKMGLCQRSSFKMSAEPIQISLHFLFQPIVCVYEQLLVCMNWDSAKRPTFQFELAYNDITARPKFTPIVCDIHNDFMFILRTQDDILSYQCALIIHIFFN